ncbi:metal ABC transporter permease [Tuberibacillus sp. Marseille-P3662]|uniref:metal ABC transporter permease n=1 Tax=Tuberibacillus sp. Marseille-P3662 TaxID=1965358 RepID=UPI001592CB0A|nr:metal ABC transporter permease [Tuberibacillus sp. Marseille-P3662]
MNAIEAFLTYPFLQRSLWAALIIGGFCPLLGAFIVVRRQALIADAVSHLAFTGLASGFAIKSFFPVFTFISPTYFAMVFAFLGSFVFKPLSKAFRYFEELSIPVVLSSALGLGIVLLNFADAVNTDLNAYLFGSLLTVTREKLMVIVSLTMIVGCLLYLFRRPLIIIAFERDTASLLSRRQQSITEWLFLFMTAGVISATMLIVGVLLISAVVVLPVLAALNYARSFRQLLLFSALFGELELLTGMISGFMLNLPPGGTFAVLSFIVMTATTVHKQGRKKMGKQLSRGYGGEHGA